MKVQSEVGNNGGSARGEKEKHSTLHAVLKGDRGSNRKSRIHNPSRTNYERDKGGIDIPVDTPANRGETWWVSPSEGSEFCWL